MKLPLFLCISLLSSVVLVVPGAVLSEAHKTLDSIYVVDIQRVIDESIIGKAARNNVEADIKKSSLKLEQQKVELDKLRTEIDKQSALLSPDALEGKRDLLSKKEKEFSRAYQDQREEVSKKNGAEIGKVIEQIDKVVKELAGKNNYDFILERDSRFVVYADSKLDLTADVIKILDSEKLKL